MSKAGAAVGRAAFRATHAKTGGKFPPKKGSSGSQPHGSNEAIVKEALRSLDPEQSKIEAAKNPNIVLADEVLNENWVNDGNGGMKPATSFKEALDYLASRNAQLFRKQTANDYELTEIVVHLPDNLCIDDPVNVSYVLDENGKQVISEKTGQPLTKPRRIARDPDEARRYFNDAQEFLTEHGIVAGGHDGLHWRTDQYSEHRPHMQLGFDSYAVDPKHPGFLRNEFSRTWFSHRDVVYPDGHPKAGKSKSGKVKLSDYQTAMREHMIERGWPVEAEIDKANEGSYLGKKNYARADNNRIIAEDRLAAAMEGEIRNARDRRELDRDSEIVASNREDVIAEREEVLDELELVSRVKKSNAADAAQNTADRAALDEARIDDAEALSWHRSDADADILAARVAAEEDLAELHYATRRRERLASTRIAAAAAFEESLRETGYRELDKIEDVVKRQQLTNEFEGAMAKIEPLPPVENRHAAAARRDRAQKGAARAALLDSDAPQQTRDRNVHDGLG